MKVTAPKTLALPTLRVVVAEGESIDVPDDVGADLVAQGWRGKAPRKAPRKPKAPVADTTDQPAEPAKEA